MRGSARRLSVPAAAALILLGAAPAAAAAQPLFRDSSVIEVSIRADLPSLFNDRDSTRRRAHPGILRYAGPGGRSVEMPVDLTTLPHSRRSTQTCTVPRVRVRFHRASSRGTIFEGQRSLKLVTHCRPRREYESYVIEEYLAYRALNVVTDTSFRVRLAQVTWSSTRDRNHRDTRWAFFVESDAAMARRLKATLLQPTVQLPPPRKTATKAAPRAPPKRTPAARRPVRPLPPLPIDTSRATFLALFEYFIGNTDWALLPSAKNVRRVSFPRAGRGGVPYDFDYAGVVGARYAEPAKGLPIRNVRDRLWRGLCTTPAEVAPHVERLRASFDRIRAAYQSAPLSENRRQRALRYYEEFFELADDPERFAVELSRPCPTGSP